jgi:hypothetical protein
VQLFNRIRDIQFHARQNLVRAKEKSKHYYDKKIRPCKYKIGDKTYIIKEPKKGKLSDQYKGPYKITKILPNNNVIIKLSERKERITHMDKLKISRTKASPECDRL